MRLPFSFFLAMKYLRPKRSFVSAVTLLSMTGVMLGCAVLIIVLSVMTGFDEMWREKILGFNAHVTVSEYGGVMHDPQTVLDAASGMPGVQAAAPYLEGLVFVQTESDQVFSPVLRGVDPQLERGVSRIPDSMIDGAFDVSEGKIVIGRDLSVRLGAAVGDVLTVYSPQSFVSEDEIRLPSDLEISGIFELGMYQFDAGYVLAGIPSARRIYALEQGVHRVAVMLEDPYAAPEFALELQNVLPFPYRAVTWMEENSQLFSALQVEKNMMFFLLIFITIVAAFGITNTLITLAVQKTHEIGVLKALGFTSGRVMRIFVWLGFVQGVFGSVLGVGLGMLVLRYRNELLRFLSFRLNIDLLPKELYQLAQIPAHTTWQDVSVITVSVIVICTLAGLIPARRAAKLDPVEAIRYE